MILQRVTHQLGQYRAELRLCAAMGATPASRLRLAAETVRFHVMNRAAPGSRPEPPHPFPVALGGGRADLWLRPLSGDFFVLHELFVGECYFVPPTWRAGVAVVADLGANIGLTTLYLRGLFPQASFVCVEPDPANAELLRRNVASLGPRAKVIEAAVSDAPGEASFDDSRPSWGRRLQEGPGTGRRVRCVTMDEVLAHAGGRIDLLKIDIEGAEARVLSGPCGWAAAVGTLVIELHEPYSLARFTADMDRLGFTIYPPSQALGTRMLFARNRRLDASAP